MLRQGAWHGWLQGHSSLGRRHSYHGTETFGMVYTYVAFGMDQNMNIHTAFCSKCFRRARTDLRCPWECGVLYKTSTHCLVLSALALIHRRDPSQQRSQLPPSRSTECEVSVQSLCAPQLLRTGRCCVEEHCHHSHHTPGCRQ